MKLIPKLGAVVIPGPDNASSPLSFSRRVQCRVYPPKRTARASKLTGRHYRLAPLLAAGLRDKEIAYELGITTGVVKVYVHELMQLTGRPTRIAVAQWWQEQQGGKAFDRFAEGEVRMGAFE